MSVIQTTEAAQTTVTTALASTTVPAENMLNWIQTRDTVPAYLGSYRMMTDSPVMVSRDGALYVTILRHSD